MAKSDNQKLKLLALKDMLERETYFESDQDKKALTMAQILEKLQQEWNIEAERKSIYSDLAYLRDYYDHVEMRDGIHMNLSDVGQRSGYALQSRLFQFSEVRLLIDAVQSSKFITEKNSRELIEKLKLLVSLPQAKSLNREVHIANRSKTPNQGIFARVDSLHRAIENDKIVTFKYYDWNPHTGQLDVARHGGKVYRVSPWKLVWQDDNYYLIASEDGEKRHYRVDKMREVTVTRAKRRGLEEAFGSMDIAEYTGSMFGMFNSNPPERVTLRFQASLAGVIIDRFGAGKGASHVQYIDEGNGWYHFTVEVVPSVQFYGWLCGLGTGIEVTAPASVRAKMAQTVDEIRALYRD